MARIVHRQADGVCVFLFGCGNDRFRGLAQPQVDDLHARVTQDAGNHLDAAIVPVKPEFGQHDSDRSVVHRGFDHQKIAVST